MKTKIVGVLLLAMLANCVKAQQFTEKINREMGFEKPTNNTVMIFNINGPINVTGYEGTRVVVEVTKTIRAKTERRLELGKAEVKLGVRDRADTLMLYVDGVCSQFGQSKSRRNNNGNRKTNHWGYAWNNRGNDDGCQEEYDYEMNFVIKVPAGVNLYASTINNGDVTVENVSGTVYINNINGSIALKNIAGATDASTINGSVDLEYSKNPPDDSRYYSLNGDINAFFRKGLTANVAFESFNGEFYTNVDQLEAIPTLVEKVPAEAGIRFRVQNNRYKIGKGGVLLDFETFNGNVYLKEKAN